MDIQELFQEIVEFRDERDWAQFHTPKELATAISIEAAELQELMLWKNPANIRESLQEGSFAASVREEAADVLIFTLLLCHETNIDPTTAIKKKLEENRKKYPVDLAKGNSDKYTEFSPKSVKDGD